MSIFWRLVLAHFMADFTFQTNWVAEKKRESQVGMVIHVFTHPLISIALVWPYLFQPWLVTPWFSCPGWACLALIGFSHWLQDELRIWFIQKMKWSDSTLLFLWDQAVHLLILFVMTPSSLGVPIEQWVFIGIGAVLLTHFCSVLVFFLEKDFFHKSDVLSRSKYRYMAERLVGAALFLIPGPGLILGVGWIGWMGYCLFKKPPKRSWMHVVAANGMVVMVALFLRGLLYN